MLSRFGVGGGKTEVCQSGGSTLRRGGTRSSTSSFTTVVFSFCDEQFPYRTKIPGKQVTLRQFKEFLPKKGSYRSVSGLKLGIQSAV